jgi:uncharacterized protein (DUF342 family)
MVNFLISNNPALIKKLHQKTLLYIEHFQTYDQLLSFMKEKKVSSAKIVIIDDELTNWADAATRVQNQLKEQKIPFSMILLTPDAKRKEKFAGYFDAVKISLPNADNLIKTFREQHKTLDLEESLLNLLSVEEIKEISSSEEPKYMIPADNINMQATLKLAQKGINPQQIYYQLKPHIVFPEKNIVKNISKIQKKISYSSQSFYINDTDTLVAKHLGLAYFQDDKLYLQPLIFTSPHQMKAYALLCIIPGLTREQSLELFFKEMKTQGICEGVTHDEMMHGFKEIDKHLPIKWTLVAKGKYPIDGHNTYVLFLKEKPEVQGKIIDTLGTMDYREREGILQVVQGEAVAKIIPEVQNEDGFDVTGTVLKSNYTYKTPIKIGNNLELDPETLEYRATIDGMVTITPGFLSVEETLVIPGNVDMESGNIHYDKNIVVKGDIRAGMKVECGGNLIVYGIIENASIKTEGELMVRGIIGCQEEPVFAKGNVYLKFIENSKLDSLKSIHINKEAINSNIRAGEKIKSQKNAKIHGGTLTASTGMDLYSIGNEDHIKTQCDLGANFYIESKLSLISTHLKKLKKQIYTEIKNISEYIDLKKNVKQQLAKMPESRAQQILEEFSQIKQLREGENQFEELYDELRGSMKQEVSSYLAVEGSIYPNVFITIIGISRTIKKIYSNTIFYLDVKDAFIANSSLELSRSLLS